MARHPTIFLAALALLSPAAQAQVVSSEVELVPASPQRVGYAPQVPALAFDGVRFLLVWTDDRMGSTNIWGVHLDLNGSVVESAPFLVAGGFCAVNPRAACLADGGGCFVTWHEEEILPEFFPGIGPYLLKGALFDMDGGVAPPYPFLFAVYTARSGLAVDGANGSDFLITGLRIDWDAIISSSVLQSGQIWEAPPWPDAGISYIGPVAGFDGTDYVVAWGSPSGLFAATAQSYFGNFNPTFEVSSDVPIGIGESQASALPSMLLAWTSQVDGNVRALRLLPDGMFQDSTPFVLGASSGPGRLYDTPAVTADALGWWVVWPDDDNTTGPSFVHAARVGVDGTVLDPGGVLWTDAGTAQLATAACGAGTCWAAWGDGFGGAADVLATRMTWDAGLLDSPPTQPIDAIASPRENRPAIACGGAGCAVAWTGRASAAIDVHVASLDPSGAALGWDGGVILSEASLGEFGASLAAGATTYLALWESDIGFSYQAQYSRLAPDGTLLDGPGVVVSTDEATSAAAVTWDGADYLIAWGSSSGTRALRVLEDGGDLDGSGFAVCPGCPSISYALALASTSGVSLAVMTGEAARISNGGSLDPAGIPLFDAGVFMQTLGFSVAAGTNQFLVSWVDSPDDTTAELRACRVGIDGSVLDYGGIVLAQWPLDLSEAFQPDWLNNHGPALAADDAGYWIMWSSGDGGQTDVYARRLPFVGPAIDGELLVSGYPTNEINPAVVATGDGAAYVLYARFDPASAYENLRLRGRFVTQGAIGAICSSGVECLSGACVSGVCGVLVPDAGAPDAGAADAGAPDAGAADAGAPDAGAADAGAPDAGAADAGAMDAGAMDAGGTDSGVLSDAGFLSDGGRADGGGSRDGGLDAGASSGFTGGGCGCSSNGADAAPLGIWLVLALGIRRCVRRPRPFETQER